MFEDPVFDPRRAGQCFSAGVGEAGRRSIQWIGKQIAFWTKERLADGILPRLDQAVEEAATLVEFASIQAPDQQGNQVPHRRWFQQYGGVSWSPFLRVPRISCLLDGALPDRGQVQTRRIGHLSAGPAGAAVPGPGRHGKSGRGLALRHEETVAVGQG